MITRSITEASVIGVMRPMQARSPFAQAPLVTVLENGSIIQVLRYPAGGMIAGIPIRLDHWGDLVASQDVIVLPDHVLQLYDLVAWVLRPTGTITVEEVIQGLEQANALFYRTTVGQAEILLVFESPSTLLRNSLRQKARDKVIELIRDQSAKAYLWAEAAVALSRDLDPKDIGLLSACCVIEHDLCRAKALIDMARNSRGNEFAETSSRVAKETLALRDKVQA